MSKLCSSAKSSSATASPSANFVTRLPDRAEAHVIVGASGGREKLTAHCGDEVARDGLSRQPCEPYEIAAHRGRGRMFHFIERRPNGSVERPALPDREPRASTPVQLPRKDGMRSLVPCDVLHRAAHAIVFGVSGLKMTHDGADGLAYDALARVLFWSKAHKKFAPKPWASTQRASHPPSLSPPSRTPAS